jgi:HlyD family secretion protein
MKLQIKFSPEPAEIIPVKMAGLPSRFLATKAKLNSLIALNRGNANLNLTRLCRRQLNIKSQLALFVAISLLIITGCKPSGGHAQYETSPAVRGNIIQRVTASGTLSAVVSVDVGSQVSGKISALYVDFNSPVKKGQLVAEIDPTVYQAVMQQAQGDLASARADVTLKGQNLERKKILVPLKAASQLDLDQATAELAQAQATITIKQAALESAQANLGYCKINAPVDGIVISRDVDLGQTITAGFTTPILFTIAQDITKMNIKADVSEADIGQVKDGQPVDFTVDAFPDDVFKGTVTQVRKSPTTTQNVVTYQVIISVENPAQKLFPGMTADVSILAAENDKALEIPNTALRYTPPDNAAYDGTPPANLQRNQHLIYSTSANGMKLKPIVVKTGITDGVNTEILDGLSDGTPVVTSTLAASAKAGGFGGGPPGGGAP